MKERRLARLTLALTSGLFLACGTQSPSPTGTGGTSGSAGPSGAAGSSAGGGSSGGAGTGGGAGTSAGTGGGYAGTTGTAGSAGSTGTAGASAGRGGSGGGAAGSGGRGGTGSAGTGGAGGTASRFSFFLTSVDGLVAMTDTCNGAHNDLGLGGDLRCGEATGLAGADKICATLAERSMPGAGAKQWRAFLSTVAGPVHARDRVGQGPWYDRMGRLVASNLTQLVMERPGDAESAIKNDLPNEYGVPNHNPDGSGIVDNHDTLTGTGTNGMLYMNNKDYTCNDWTSQEPAAGKGPWTGHSWPARSGMNWMSALREGGCGPGINLEETGGPERGVYTVGTGGGYGGFYCFALTP